jgi:hypothetical protein
MCWQVSVVIVELATPANWAAGAIIYWTNELDICLVRRVGHVLLVSATCCHFTGRA